jgi:hypothetical protein
MRLEFKRRTYRWRRSLFLFLLLVLLLVTIF